MPLWADPKGTFLAEKEAEKVYELYKLQSSLPDQPPSVNRPVVKPPLAYHIREGKHDLTAYDWAQFVRMADLHFKAF
jgi:hypothetical protein